MRASGNRVANAQLLIAIAFMATLLAGQVGHTMPSLAAASAAFEADHAETGSRA